MAQPATRAGTPRQQPGLRRRLPQQHLNPARLPVQPRPAPGHPAPSTTPGRVARPRIHNRHPVRHRRPHAQDPDLPTEGHPRPHRCRHGRRRHRQLHRHAAIRNVRHHLPADRAADQTPVPGTGTHRPRRLRLRHRVPDRHPAPRLPVQPRSRARSSSTYHAHRAVWRGNAAPPVSHHRPTSGSRSSSAAPLPRAPGSETTFSPATASRAASAPCKASQGSRARSCGVPRRHARENRAARRRIGRLRLPGRHPARVAAADGPGSRVPATATAPRLWHGGTGQVALATRLGVRPFVFRSPAPARAHLGSNLQPGTGIASQLSPRSGRRNNGPGRRSVHHHRTAHYGAATPPWPSRSCGQSHGRSSSAAPHQPAPGSHNLQPGAGIASRRSPRPGRRSRPCQCPEFRPRPQRAFWRGIAARVPAAAPLTAYQRPPPPPRSPAPHRALWHGHTAPPTPLGAPQVTVPVVEFRPPPPQRVLWRGLANLTSRTPPVTPVGFIQPALPFIDFRPPPPPRGYFGPHRIIGPEPVPAGPGTPGAYQRTAPQVKRPAPARAWIGHGGTAGGIASRIVTPLGKLGPPRPFVARSPLPPRPRGLWRGLASHVITPRGTLPPPRKVPQFPPKITRARIGPLSAIAGGIASPIVTPPPPAPGILPQPTWTVAATVPLTVDAAPTVPMTIVVNPTAPMTIDITPGATHLPPPGQQVIPAQPQVRLNPELPPPIGQPS